MLTNHIIQLMRLIRTEVVLKCMEGDFIIYLSSFNKNRSCIEISAAEQIHMVLHSLIRTEVVLKYPLGVG